MAPSQMVLRRLEQGDTLVLHTRELRSLLQAVREQLGPDSELAETLADVLEMRGSF